MKAVKAIILNKEGKILLLKRTPLYERKKVISEFKLFKFLDKKDIWDLPGGGIDKDETEMRALKREVKEELNVDIRILSKQEEWSFITLKGKERKVINYVCEIISDIKKMKLSEEHKEYKWVDVKDIRKYKVKDESLYKAIEKLKK